MAKDTKIKGFLKQRGVELSGIFLASMGVYIALSLLTYNPYDPSYNLASDAVVKNWGGAAGAYIADPILQSIGLGSIILAILPLIWGGKIVYKQPFSSAWIRGAFTLMLLPSAAAMVTLLDTLIIPSEQWPTSSFGGYIGSFVQENATQWVPMAVYAPIVIAATLSLFFISSNLTLSSWKAIGVNLKHAVLWFPQTAIRVKETFVALIQPENALPVQSKPKKARKIVERKSTAATAQKSQTQSSFDLEVRGNYQLPPLNLLKAPSRKAKEAITESALSQNAELLEKVLDDFGVKGKIVEVQPGPVVTLYALEPSPGTKSSRVIGLSDDIARSMSATSARIAVIPGRNAIGIELPNNTRETVYLKETLDTDEYKNAKHQLPLALGKNIAGENIIIDLAKTPHLLVAGTTGSGKSVGLNGMILSLLHKFTPDECKFIMVDPKMLELSVYQDIPHLLAPVVTEPGKAVVALKWTVKEMENRYRLMSNLGVRNIQGYNEKIKEAKAKGEVLNRTVQTGFDVDTGKPIIETVPLDMEPLPFIVVIVDEMADLMLVAGKDIESSIQRLAQMARAAGIHIILATQRPSVDVITGIIKANFPTRISFQVTSKIDSRTILGEQGAEQLLGMGDMLYMAGGSRIVRVHGPFVDDSEVERITSFIKQQGSPSYVEDVTVNEEEEGGMADMGPRDELFDAAVAIVTQEGKASTSFVQRSLKIGYNRAANIIEAMEKDGIVSKADHVGRREVLLQHAE